jgi:uncharacterized protein
MNSSKVFFIDFHASSKQNILKKFHLLLTKAGMQKINFTKKMVALKIHFGEPGNLSYIRPNFVRVVSEIIKEFGGLPFLTDTNTLYKGKRSNAVDHIQSAMENGFSPITTGCNIIIADGLKGNEYKEIEINLKHCKTAKIGSAIANADIMITINHFKGHEMAGFGGALKNMGMGSGSIGGKLVMHSDSQPAIVRDHCTGCEVCVENCAYDAIHLDNENIASINYSVCSGCGQCIAMCQYDAAQPQLNAANMQEKMMEYAYAADLNKTSFHINFIMDVSPQCDCWHYNDIPIVPDIGILASFDPVALDRASVDLVNKAPVNENSMIGKTEHHNKDRFGLVFPTIDWRPGLNYAEEIGLGNQNYELITIQ